VDTRNISLTQQVLRKTRRPPGLGDGFAEDAGAELAAHVVDFIAATPSR
jgi:hypothetical protein